MKKLGIKRSKPDGSAKVLSLNPPTFTVSAQDLERYGWSAERQLENNPSVLLELLFRRRKHSKKERAFWDWFFRRGDYEG